MYNLGSYYYESRRYALALKYFEMIEAAGSGAADVNLGYIWYYGRTGRVDYQKAFCYYERAMRRGSRIAAYKIADMYRRGYFVQRDEKRYKAIIRGLYLKVRGARSLNEPLPEVFSRLAEIDAQEGRTAHAVKLCLDARAFLARRIRGNPFFGDLNIMEALIGQLYALTEFDRDDFALYDLFYLLKAPCKVHFCCGGRQYSVKSVLEEGGCAVCFEGKWYRTCRDFLAGAAVDGVLLTTQYDMLYSFEVIE